MSSKPSPLCVKNTAWILLACVASCVVTSTAQADDEDDNEDDPQNERSFVCLAEQAIYHTNLFHLNDSVTDIGQRLGPGASRYNTSLRTSACVQERWQWNPQEFKLDADIDDNRFLDNKILNHTSGNADLLWNWQTAGNWHGQLGGDYKRALGTFVNDRPLVKDVVDSYHYFMEVNHDFGAHIIARVRGEHTDTSHDADSRLIDNYRNNTGIAEILLMSRAENYLGISAQRVQALYPYTLIINDITYDRDYREETVSLRAHYEIESKTIFAAAVSHVKHDYQHDPTINYSGYTWRTSLDWQPRGNIQFVLAGWKDLASYFDTEADHFISRGASLTPKWMPHEKVTISLPLRWERQQYIFRNIETAGLLPREDEVKIAGVEVLYRPRPSFDIDVNYGYEKRDSSIDVYSYLDEMTSLQIQWSF